MARFVVEFDDGSYAGYVDMHHNILNVVLVDFNEAYIFGDIKELDFFLNLFKNSDVTAYKKGFSTLKKVNVQNVIPVYIQKEIRTRTKV